MKHYLLLGAGFSRNWGGWLAAEAFEYLLGCKEVLRRPALRDLLWRYKEQGFEAALSQVQQAAGRDSKSQEDLRAFQSSVRGMFDDMNSGFFASGSIDFSPEAGWLVRELLASFDAIFTLNQDLLLERCYMASRYGGGALQTVKPKKFYDAVLPGVRGDNDFPGRADSWLNWKAARWIVEKPPYAIKPTSQPIFKLHGSAQWHDEAGSDMLVMGGAKSVTISAQPLLSAYMKEFSERLLDADARLMVIGYSFGDPHITSAIRAGAEKDLKLFIIDPAGVDIVNTSRKLPIRVADPLEQAIIGASRRTLREIFSSDRIEHDKVMRFFRV